jgi:energy-converting hydrogenase Eha subunit C
MSDKPQFTEENLMILMTLLICTFGAYSLIWLARTSKAFGDDPVTQVVMTVLSGGVWGLVLNLRYLDMAERLNGRDLAWYNAILAIFPLPLMGTMMVQLNLNEAIQRDQGAKA